MAKTRAPADVGAAGAPTTRRVSFSVVVAIMVLFQVGAAAPTPLYVVYQRLWGFSSATLTLIFAVFVFGLLCSLLVLGALSDYLGRQRVLLAGIALAAVAVALFLIADGPGMLMAARAVQGIATGMVLPTLGAALVDFNPPHAPHRATVVNGVVPIGGLALGSLVCGALVQYGPDPTHLVWAVLLAAMVLAWLAVLALPESSVRRPWTAATLLPRLGVPRRLRRDVFALAPLIVASWALGGLYLSLGPSAAAAVFGITDHFLGGLVATLLCGAGALTAYALRRPANSFSLRLSALLSAGTAVTLLAVVTGSITPAVIGTIAAGIGYGAAALATFGALARLAGTADSGERGELFAVAYTVAYLSFSLPAVAAGYASTVFGLHTTLVVYSLTVITIGAAAVAIQHARLAKRGSRNSVR
ncbi:MAG: MFS transporter [Nocardioidaceae bacterium]